MILVGTEDHINPQGFDAKTVNELFRGSKPTIGPVQALERKKITPITMYI
jgi:hypothetical protein